MDIRPDALYSAVLSDLQSNLVRGPVGPLELPPDVSYRTFASHSLLFDLTRKWVPDQTDEIDARSFEKFLASNKKCRDWAFSPKDLGDETLFSEFLREIDNFLHPGGQFLFDSYFQFLGLGRTGPGSAIGARGQSLYAKLFNSRLTSTSEWLYKIYSSYVEWFPSFGEAERQRHQEFGAVDIVNGSRCSFVPKTKDISRMICVEPIVNMYCQLGLGALLEERMNDLFDIDLSIQPSRNRRLAYLGSKDGSFSTIDLSSASDSISLRMCELIFPKWFFQTLLELRSHSTTYKGLRVPLFMISTMGNGFTFPLQTVIFSCLIRAAYHVCGEPVYDGVRQNWACFGDDLICKTRVFPYVIRLLNMLGFETNSSKTFSEGQFRESCGTDWFLGQPVRSIFVKSLRSQQDIFVAINLLNSWSAYTGIPLINGINYLVGLLSKPNRTLFVPFDENNDAGIRVPSTLLERLRYGYFRKDGSVVYTILYRAYRNRPKRIFIRDGTIRVPRGGKFLTFNPNGLHVSFLFGELVDHSISIRHDINHYDLKLRCTPYWDYIPVDNETNGVKLSWRQWETAVLINFSNPT